MIGTIGTLVPPLRLGLGLRLEMRFNANPNPNPNLGGYESAIAPNDYNNLASCEPILLSFSFMYYLNHKTKLKNLHYLV